LKPDLTTTSVTVPARQVTEGDAVTFSAAVGNLGPGDAANAVVRFLVDGAQVGGDQTVSLAAGANAIVSSGAWTATAGTHTVEAVVDPDNAIVEIDETNNAVSNTVAAQRKADLTPGAVSLSSVKAKGGDLVTFTVQVANRGEATASNVGVRFLVDGAQVGIARTIAQLAGGASASVSSDTWSAAHRDGPHTVQVLVDPANTVVESNEANNTAAATFRVTGGRVVS
jgi:subtilase family serine protease